jgi:hypothetical protein
MPTSGLCCAIYSD